jgi:hypothetical protein
MEQHTYPKPWTMYSDSELIVEVKFFPRNIGWQITTMEFEKLGWKLLDDFRIFLISRFY